MVSPRRHLPSLCHLCALPVPSLCPLCALYPIWHGQTPPPPSPHRSPRRVPAGLGRPLPRANAKPAAQRGPTSRGKSSGLSSGWELSAVGGLHAGSGLHNMVPSGATPRACDRGTEGPRGLGAGADVPGPVQPPGSGKRWTRRRSVSSSSSPSSTRSCKAAVAPSNSGVRQQSSSFAPKLRSRTGTQPGAHRNRQGS